MGKVSQIIRLKAMVFRTLYGMSIKAEAIASQEGW